MFFFKKKKNTATVSATAVAKKVRQCSFPSSQLLTDQTLTGAEKSSAKIHNMSIRPLSSPTFSIERPLPPLPYHSIPSRESSHDIMCSSMGDGDEQQQQQEERSGSIADRQEEEQGDVEDAQGGSDAIKEAEQAEEDPIVNHEVTSVESRPADKRTEHKEGGAKDEEKEAVLMAGRVMETASPPPPLLRLTMAVKTAESDQVLPSNHSKGSTTTSNNSTSGIPRRRYSPAAVTAATVSTLSASGKNPLINKKLDRFSPNPNSLLPIPKVHEHQRKQLVPETSRQCRTGLVHPTRLPVRRAT